MDADFESVWINFVLSLTVLSQFSCRLSHVTSFLNKLSPSFVILSISADPLLCCEICASILQVYEELRVQPLLLRAAEAGGCSVSACGPEV